MGVHIILTKKVSMRKQAKMPQNCSLGPKKVKLANEFKVHFLRELIVIPISSRLLLETFDFICFPLMANLELVSFIASVVASGPLLSTPGGPPVFTSNSILVVGQFSQIRSSF